MDKIRERLESLYDADHQRFLSVLIPSIERDRILGLRSPQLKALVREYWQEDRPQCLSFLQELPHKYFEEDCLQMAFIGREKDFESCIGQLEAFLPSVDNWAVCDGPLPTCFRKHKEELSGYIQKWLKSDHTYTVRYAIGCRMRLYLQEGYDPCYTEEICQIDSGEYYIEMMQGWYLATALIAHPEILELLKKGELPEGIRQKAIRKAIESFRIKDEVKEALRKLR
ncbi:MAG: DNA alkylation repair protein [Erysipelotrichaceae bacterium]|nr:DNA alkylation repair protein [Erysipelotrichaceae bacterium]